MTNFSRSRETTNRDDLNTVNYPSGTWFSIQAIAPDKSMGRLSLIAQSGCRLHMQCIGAVALGIIRPLTCDSDISTLRIDQITNAETIGLVQPAVGEELMLTSVYGDESTQPYATNLTVVASKIYLPI